MSTIAKQYLQLSFTTDTDKTVSVNIPNPNLSADDTLVNTVMDNLIGLGVMNFTGGRPISKNSAKLVTVNEEEVTM